MPASVIAHATRTPFGRFGGALKEESAVDLGATISRKLLEKSSLQPEDIDESYFGSAILAASTLVAARQINIKAGIPSNIPSLTVDRACCSSMTAIGLGDSRVRLGKADIVLCGGVESCSRTPFLQRGVRWGRRLGDFQIEDPLQFRNPLSGEPLARVTGEVALAHGVSREEQDDWAFESHQKFFQALDRGFFRDEVTSLTAGNDKAEISIDEAPRRDISREKLGKLKTVHDSPTVTPGNAPGLNDGASAVLVMSSEEAQRRRIEPLCEILLHVQLAGATDSSPYLPGHAIAAALKESNLILGDLKRIEINEAFAAMPLVSTKYLADDDKGKLKQLRKITNINGGAVAIGHPTGASGARIVMTLARSLRELGGGYGVAAICGGFGQADAILIRV